MQAKESKERALIRCATCGIAIKWRPTIIKKELFCCVGCACGGPCTCDYEHLPAIDHQAVMIVSKNMREETRSEIIHIVKED